MECANMLCFEPPSVSLIKTLMAPQQAVLRLEWIGMNNVPKKDTPALYVMNHFLYGLEMPSFVGGLYLKINIYVRGLADHFHICSPHGSILKAFGGVDGTRANVDSLMEAKQNILVYPGGGQEVLKHSSVPKYSLLWKEHLGFARLAIKHGYPIVPCALVGMEDMIDIVANINLKACQKGQFLPVGSVNPKKLQKLYFWVGEPIPTAQYKGEWTNDNLCREVRDKTKAAVEQGIKTMQKRQQTDPDRFLMQQFANNVRAAKERAAQTIQTVFRRTNSEDSVLDEKKAE
jgi:1-acyl-sn-glycerol-3-phosphate acyltransferase